MVYTLLIPSGTRGVLYCAITPTAFLFYLLGHECKRLDLRRYENRCFIIPVLIVLLCGLSYYNEPIFMYSNTYGHPIVFLLTSTIGVVLVYAISKHLQDNRFLIWCGVNSIYIYVLHLKIRVAVNAVVMSFDMIPDFVQGLTIFVITGIITLCGCVICKRYLWFMFGDKSRRFIDK